MARVAGGSQRQTRIRLPSPPASAPATAKQATTKAASAATPNGSAHKGSMLSLPGVNAPRAANATGRQPTHKATHAHIQGLVTAPLTGL